jgi:hypothetical protein
VIAALRKGFVNTWLLAKDLDGIAARSKDPDLARLCKLIKDNYGYPVDSVLIGADLRVLGHVNVHEDRAMVPGSYLGFLRDGLAAARGEAPASRAVAAKAAEVAADGPGHPRAIRAVTLTPEKPTGSVLDVIHRRRFGEMSMAFFPIDASAFTDGGTIEIAVRVGGGSASGKFELCTAVPGGMAPAETLEKVKPGGTATMTHEFTKGARFGLAAMPGAGSNEGEPNAFLATITVRKR